MLTPSPVAAAGDDDEGAMGGDGQGEVVEEERQHRWGRGRPLEGPAAVPGEGSWLTQRKD